MGIMIDSIFYYKISHLLALLQRSPIWNFSKKASLSLNTNFKMKTTLLSLLLGLSCCLIAQVPQSQPVIDILIMQHDTLFTFQTVTFTAKVPKVRMIPTISCSCGDTDFYYELYKWEEEGWKLVVDHSEKPSQPQCECKYHHAAFENEKVYSIYPITSPGTYYLRIIGWQFEMLSSAFWVCEKR